MADPDLHGLREQLYRLAHTLGCEDLAHYEFSITATFQLLTFRYGATAALNSGDIVQVVAADGHEASSLIGMIGFVVDPDTYGEPIEDSPDAGGIPVVFTYAAEDGPVRIIGRVARPRLRRVGCTTLVPTADPADRPLSTIYIPDVNELAAAAAAKRGDHG